jgi:hypothetical protein
MLKERKTRRVPVITTEDWTVIYCDTVSETEQCIKDPTMLWPLILGTVTRLIDEDRDSLPSVEIRCMEMVGSIWVTCRRAEVLETLGKMLKWRLGREEYEECAEIKAIEERFRNAPSSVKKSADTDEI